MSKFKPGDKVWVKGVVADPGLHVLHESDFVLILEPLRQRHCIRISHADMRRRVKARQPVCPWQPIETAPKDGARLFLYETGGYAWVGSWNDKRMLWAANGMVIAPSHWMPIPKLEVK